MDTLRYYFITVMLKDKSLHKGIRTNESMEIDSAFILFRGRAHESFGQSNVIYFQCVQLSKHSDEVKDFNIKRADKARIKRHPGH